MTTTYKSLPLGAVLLDRKPKENAGYEIVLAALPDNRVTPFVTWERGPDGACYWGHYIASEYKAREDFAKR